MNGPIKLESWSFQAFLKCANSGAYPRVEHLKGTSLALAPTLLANIAQEGKSLPGTRSLDNRTSLIIHPCRKTAVLSCHRCLINTGVKKCNIQV